MRSASRRDRPGGCGSRRPARRLTVQAALAEVEVPGVASSKALVLPAVPDAWGSSRRDPARGGRSTPARGCVEVDLSVRCQEGRDRTGEEDSGFERHLALPQPRRTTPELWVQARAADAAVEEELLERLPGRRVTSSSQGSPATSAPRASRPSTATRDHLDRQRATMRPPAWTSGGWGGRPCDGIDLTVSPDAAARTPRRVLLTYRGGSQRGRARRRRSARFDPVRTDFLSRPDPGDRPDRRASASTSRSPGWAPASASSGSSARPSTR